MKITWIKVDGVWKKVNNVWVNIGGVWKAQVVPKGFIGGAWRRFIEYSLDIYRNGVEGVSLSTAGFGNIGLNRQPDKLILTASQLSAGGRGAIYTTQPIDVTNYTRLNVRVTKGPKTRFYFGVVQDLPTITTVSNSTTEYSAFFAYTNNDAINDLTDFSVDVSGVAGDYYVQIKILQNLVQNNEAASLDIYEIILE